MQQPDPILQKASSTKSLCMATFFFLGNYFAMYGFLLAENAVRELVCGNRQKADKLLLSARRWGIWGLLPSTILNAAFLYFCFMALWKLGLKDLFADYSRLR